MLNSSPRENTNSLPLNIFGDVQGITRIFYWFTAAILVSQIGAVVIVLTDQDTLSATILAISILPIPAVFLFIQRKKFEWAAVFLALLLLALITLLATLGLGIHHISNLGYPMILIVSSMVTRKRTMVFLTLCATGCVAWLVFGELSGAYTPHVLVRSVPGDFLSTSLAIAVTAFMVRLLSETLFKNNRRLQQELVERSRAEAALRESERQLRLIADNIPAVVNYVNAQDLRYRFVNRSYAALFGLSPEHLVGKQVSEIMDEAAYARALPYINRARAGEHVSFENIVTAREEQRWFNIKYRPELDERGAVQNIVVLAVDITDRKRAEEETALKNKHLTLLNHLGQALNKLASPSEILERISSLIGQVFDNRNLYIAVYDEATNFVSFPIYWMAGERKQSLEGRPLSNGLTEFVIHARAPVLISDHVQEAMAKRGITLIGTPCQCYLGVPILIDERVLGVIAVQDYEHAQVYDANHVELLSTIASQAAIALENARLYETVQQELTERKRAEEALRESEERYRTLYQNSTMGIYRTTPAGDITLANPALVKMLGYTSADELRARNLEHAGYEPAYSRSQFLETISREGEVRGLESAWQRRDGSVLYVRESARAIRTTQGDIAYFDGTVEDITDRKRVEEALRESESLYHSLVEVSPLCICRKDLAGRFTFANQRFLGESQISQTDLVGKTDFDLHPPQLAEKYRRDDQAVMDSGQVRELIEERTLLGGESIVVQSIKTPIYDGVGQINGVQISFWDITARQQAESQREAALNALRELNITLEQRVADRTAEVQAANVRLTELDRMKDEFMSRISHELRTPLTNVKIYLELLETGKLEKRDKYMQTLKRETDRLHTLIEEVLMFSQINLYIRPATLDLINLNGLIEGRLTTWQKLCAPHRLDLQLRLAQAVPPARADSQLLVQALTRVITNAANYTPTGSVIISTARRDEDDRGWATISVTDTGPGITPEDLPHIFERFYRGRAAADYKTPGAGIGLSISHEIIEKMGGRLTVETQVGVGSTFILWLPAAASGTASAADPDSP
jgi:PAS domain S-box-containing protein